VKKSRSKNHSMNHTMKPIHLLCAFLALSASHLFAAEPSRAFLAPATTTGEEAAGFIPVAAVDQSTPASEKNSETQGGAGAMQASLSFTSVRDRKEDRKTKVVTITQNEVLGVRIAGLPTFLHNETYDDKGLLTKSDSLLPRGNPNFYSATFQSPGVNIQIAPKQAARFMYGRYLGGAVASGDEAARGLLVFDVLEKAESKARLVIRMVSGKDGWQRWMFSTDEGMLFERVPFGHRPEKDAIAGREESLWLMGQTDDERKDSGQAKSMPLDANLPGAVWYGSGKKGANLAGYAVFSPATAATVKAGNWSKGELSVVSLASQDADLRVMLKESKNFGDPQAELAAFAQELPKLSLDLDKTSFVLPLDAEGLGLDAGKRAFIERLLASAPALEATSAEAKPAAEKLRSALENYDRAMSFLKAAKTDSERLKAEVPAVLARGALEDNIDPLAKIWADAGGVESPAGTTLAAPTAGTPVPPDARYSTEAPAYGPETTKWLGEKSPGKKLSVLVLYGGVDFWEQHGRKLVELKRALNLDMEYAMAYQSDTMSSRVDEQRIRQLLASRRWDVILDWNVQSMHGPADNINILPPDIRASIYRAVMDDGTGLLLLSGKTAQEFLKADRLQPAAGQKTFAGLTLTGRVPRQSKAGGKVTPLEAEQKFADTYFGLYKAGRGLALAVDPRMGQSVSVSETPGTLYVSEMVPWGPRNKVDGDYFHAEMARMLLLAAGREPDVTFTKAPPLLSAAPGTTASLREAWGIRCKDGVKGLKATVRLRGLDGKVISEKTQEVALKNGEGEIPLTLPDLGAGTYYADLFLDSPRGRENFGYAAVLVPDAAKTSSVSSRHLPPRSIPPGYWIIGARRSSRVTRSPVRSL